MPPPPPYLFGQSRTRRTLPARQDARDREREQRRREAEARLHAAFSECRRRLDQEEPGAVVVRITGDGRVYVDRYREG